MVLVKINIDDNCLNCLSQSIFFSPLTAFWKRSLGNIIVLPFWIFIACMGLVQVCLKKTKACILQRKHICRKLKQNTYCVITSIRDKFVVHCFNNTSSEGEGKKKSMLVFIQNEKIYTYDTQCHNSIIYILTTNITYLLASSPPGGRLGMLSDANVRITWTKSGTPSSPCFLIISVGKHNLIRLQLCLNNTRILLKIHNWYEQLKYYISMCTRRITN